MPTEAPVSLFLFAHPDDEVFIGARIERELAQGARVVAVFLTDGGAASARRERESRRVLGSIGVRPDDLRFAGRAHGWRDGGLVSRLDDVWAYLHASWAGSPPARLYVPAWEGGHPDHDAVHLLGRALARHWGLPPGAASAFPLYHGEGTRGRCFRAMTPLTVSPFAPGAAPERRRLSGGEILSNVMRGLRYPSQWRSWLGLLPFCAWTWAIGRTETLEPLPVGGELPRPHAGALLYERYGRSDFGSFVREAGPFAARTLGPGARDR